MNFFAPFWSRPRLRLHRDHLVYTPGIANDILMRICMQVREHNHHAEEAIDNTLNLQIDEVNRQSDVKLC